MTITLTQLTQTAKALSAVKWDKVANLKSDSLADDAGLLEEGLAVAAVFWPPAAVIASALAVAVAIEASGLVHPDPLPMTDAQTTESRSGREE